jgi:divalent metal cation (Fe/Co/Zn/Cd) transporter
MTLVALFGWVWADVVAALVVVSLIGHAAWTILQRTGNVLVDRAPYSGDELEALVADVVDDNAAMDACILRARSRGPVDAAYIDIDVQVDPETTTARSATLADAIRDRLTTTLGGVEEVEVHFFPAQKAGHVA